jgi:hypothetical protein
METRTAIILPNNLAESSIAEKFLRGIRQRIRDIESEVDILRHELELTKTNLHSEKELHNRDLIAAQLNLQEEKDSRIKIEGYLDKLLTIQVKRSDNSLNQELRYAKSRPNAHNHSTKPGSQPVIVTDLHGTLTPSEGFMAPHLPGAMESPFPGVKEALDGWASEGCCIHISSASLRFGLDPSTYTARQALISQWVTYYNLPIYFWTGKVGAHLYYDDRMTTATPDGWQKSILDGVQVQLDYRTELNKRGIRELVKVPGYGNPIEHYPVIEDVPNDNPRGYSTPIIDVDFHGCLLKSNASDRTSDLMPGALESLKMIYDTGYRINLSCAGWDPLTHKDGEWQEILAGLRKLTRELAIPYDQIATKEHGVAFIDNFGYRFNDWKKDTPALMKLLAQSSPSDEVTSDVLSRAV